MVLKLLQPAHELLCICMLLCNPTPPCHALSDLIRETMLANINYCMWNGFF